MANLKSHLRKFKKLNGKCELLKFTDLDAADRERVASAVFSAIGASKNKKDKYKVYLSVLTKYGIICTHPQSMRSYDGYMSLALLDNYRWYKCKMCDCAVVNEHYVEYIDEEEKKNINSK